MKKTEIKKIVEEIEETIRYCDKCGVALHEPGCESRSQRLRVIVYYGENLAHSGSHEVVDHTGDFCDACVVAAVNDGDLPDAYELSVAERITRVAALLRSKKHEGEK